MANIGFIGCGNMATAIIRGIDSKQHEVLVFDVDAEKARQFAHATACESVAQLCERADIVFLCVKPNILPEVLQSVQQPNQAFVSIAAGTTSATLAQHLRVPARVMRIMPNTPLMVGMGAVCISRDHTLTQQEADLVVHIFEQIGLVKFVEERDMDAVTGVSGSGPAYVYLFVESLARAGEQNGLDYETSLALAMQTVAGACEMMRHCGDTPQELIRKVCSPGGTTIEAMQVFEQRGFQGVVQDAVDACVKKSKALSEHGAKH